jgi:ZIP family zinc transporter
MQTILFAIGTFFSTLMGGLFAIRYRDKLHYIMAFTAGVILGVVSFDILPEIIDQVKNNGYDPTPVTIALVAGFMLFHVLERSMDIHRHAEETYAPHKHPQVGILSALALAGHSFMDGVSIGLGFQISQSAGLLVSIAVISHDFTDGMNTVTVMISNANSTRRAKMLLLLDAAAPVLGALSTTLFSLPPQFLFAYLGFFAGFLLYISTSDILPEAHSTHSSYKLMGLTAIGILFIFVVTRYA